MIILVGWVIQVLAYPLIYNGLLSIGVALENPLGNAFMDLPTLAYQHYMHDECVSFASGMGAVDPTDGWWSGVVKSTSSSSRSPERSEARSHGASSDADAPSEEASSSDEEASTSKSEYERRGCGRIKDSSHGSSRSLGGHQTTAGSAGAGKEAVAARVPVVRSDTEPDLWRVIEQMKSSSTMKSRTEEMKPADALPQ